jgi:predicted kinase
MIVMVMGLPGSGKSYFAAQLSNLTGAVYINSDRVRSAILQSTTYSDREKQMVYDEMLRMALGSLGEGKDIVLDATFYTNAVREKFIQELEPLDSIVFIEIVAGESLIRQRLKMPREDSDANFEVYKEIQEEWEPFAQPHLLLWSTDHNIDDMLDQAMEYLHQDSYD